MTNWRDYQRKSTFLVGRFNFTKGVLRPWYEATL